MITNNPNQNIFNMFRNSYQPKTNPVQSRERPAVESASHSRLEGMDITGMTIADFKIVDVPDEIRDKLLSVVRREFTTNYGMSDGEEISALIRQHLENTPVADRKNVAHTLSQIQLTESQRLVDLAKDRIPGWQAGQAFDPSLFADELSGGLDYTA